MAGWRIGFCAGHPEMVRALAKIKGYYDYGIFQAIQIAAIIGFRECADDAVEQAKIYERRRDCLCRGLSRIGWDVTPPKRASPTCLCAARTPRILPMRPPMRASRTRTSLTATRPWPRPFEQPPRRAARCS